jgi:hypothetical protein
MGTDLTQVQRGQRWRNRHTGAMTTVLAVKSERRKEPTRLGQATDGRFLFGGIREVDRVLVHHTSNIPPGFKRGAGDRFESFVHNWQLAEQDGR